MRAIPYKAPVDLETSISPPLSRGVNVVDRPFSISSSRMLAGRDAALTGGTHP